MGRDLGPDCRLCRRDQCPLLRDGLNGISYALAVPVMARIRRSYGSRGACVY